MDVNIVEESGLRAGLRRLANEQSYAAYLAAAGLLDASRATGISLDPVKVAVLRNFTIEPLLPVIQGEMALANLDLVVQLGAFDNVMQEALDPRGALADFAPDVIIVALWLDNLSPAIVERFVRLGAEQRAQEVERVLGNLELLLDALRRRCTTPILINNFPLPAHPAYGIYDAQSDLAQTHTVLRLNEGIRRGCERRSGCHVVDFMSVFARLGHDCAFDSRLWQAAGAPISRRGLVSLGKEYAKFLRALRGRSRKCLVLDCDNTLWGGVVGEVGISGIELGANDPQGGFAALQRAVLNLHDRGVILALCSRNNEEDVLAVLRGHPEMLLKEEHFAALQINWDDKASNLRRLAGVLDIGLDAFVLVDDSEFECGLVMQQLPEVAVVLRPDDPGDLQAVIAAHGYFDVLSVTAEDALRNRSYREQAERQRLRHHAGSIEEYLQGLEIVAEIGPVDRGSLPRVAQLIQRTNQFNLTTRRYGDGDLDALFTDPHVTLWALRLRDRISELGLVGVAIVVHRDDTAVIDTLLMSCRALGRGAEDALLACVLEEARRRGCRQVRGLYRATGKNRQVADFYSSRGFRPIESGGEEDCEWERGVEAGSLSPPDWITVELARLGSGHG